MRRLLALPWLLLLLSCREPLEPAQGKPPADVATAVDTFAPIDAAQAADTAPAPDFVAPVDVAPAVPPGDSCDPLSPRAVPTRVFVLPDDGEKPYVDVLQKATKSIRVMAYIMGYGAILSTLTAKAKAGVDVRVLLDVGQDANPKYYDQLTAAGVTCRWSDPKFSYYHAKTMVVDDAYAVVSTGNYSKVYSVDKERNFVAQVDDPDDVADIAAIFDADWDGKTPDLACTRLLVSPVNAKARLLALIDGAKSTLLIEQMQLAETEIRDHIAQRKAAGVEVRALLAAPSWIDANEKAAAFLKQHDIPARYMYKPGVHVKALVVDGQRAYMGSVNLSWTSLTKNREVGIFLTESDAVKIMATTFEKDWKAATPF